MTPVIVADQLTRYYGTRIAVDRVSFEVRPHEVMGLLGPNGSGKSTILRILTGYLRPTSGTALIAGYDVVTHGLEARRFGAGGDPAGAERVKDLILLGFSE